MIKIRYILPLLVAYSTVLPLPAIAQKENLESENLILKQLLAMEIEELVTVTVVSKREEDIHKSPSVVNVITKDEIRRFGGQTLADIVNRMTNTHMVGSAIFSNMSTSIRGAAINHIDTHILILMNGRPIRESFGGGTNHDIYSIFPLDIIDRIEMVRGPGSVLYGTNAFSGIINIITKKETGQTSLKASATYGSFNTKKTEISGGYNNSDFQFYGTVTKTGSGGWDYGLTDVTGTPDSYDSRSSGKQAVFQASYNGFTMNSIVNKSISYSLSPLIIFPEKKNILWRNFIDIGYEHNLSKDWNVNFNATYNGHSIKLGNNILPSFDSKGYLFELSTEGKLTDKINFIAGGIYDVLKGNIPVSNTADKIDYSTWRGSVYAQGDYIATDWLKLVAGFQINQPEGINKDLSPRLAAIITFNDNWGAKFLYGSAFRSPFGTISFSNNAVVKGNPNLDPEKIETFEAQLLYHPTNYDFSLTYYNSTMMDVHERKIVGGFTTFVNSNNEITLQGIEFEGKAHLDDVWDLTGSLSYQQSEDKGGTTDVTFSPNLMAKFGISYDAGKGYTAGLFNSYFSDAGKTENTRTGVAVVNPKAEAYNLMTANLEIDIPTVLKNTSMPATKFNLFVDNILDEDILYPDTNRFTVNTVPQHSGRAIYARLTAEF